MAQDKHDIIMEILKKLSQGETFTSKAIEKALAESIGQPAFALSPDHFFNHFGPGRQPVNLQANLPNWSACLPRCWHTFSRRPTINLLPT